MIRSKMEYTSSAWIDSTPTSLAQLDSIQNTAKRVIGLPTKEYEDHCIQPLSHHRAVGAATFFHCMLYKEAQEMLCQLIPDIHVYDPRLRRSVRSHYLSCGGHKIKPCQPCKIISTIYGQIMEFSSCPNSSH